MPLPPAQMAAEAAHNRVPHFLLRYLLTTTACVAGSPGVGNPRMRLDHNTRPGVCAARQALCNMPSVTKLSTGLLWEPWECHTATAHHPSSVRVCLYRQTKPQVTRCAVHSEVPTPRASAHSPPAPAAFSIPLPPPLSATTSPTARNPGWRLPRVASAKRLAFHMELSLEIVNLWCFARA